MDSPGGQRSIAGDIDLVYVATRDRLVFGASDLAGLKTALAPV